MHDKIADLTVDELKSVVREAVEEAILDSDDPDAGLELRPELRERLRRSLSVEKSGTVSSLEDVLRRSR